MDQSEDRAAPPSQASGENAESKTQSQKIWSSLINDLTARKPEWQEEVEAISVDNIRQQRDDGHAFSDSAVFEALVLALLSSDIDWSRVRSVIGNLKTVFCSYDVRTFVECNLNDLSRIHQTLKDWKIASQNTRRMLGYLHETIAGLERQAHRYGGMDHYLSSLYAAHGKSPERLALALGIPGDAKLKGFGVPLAAEALRNLGYDLAKPDRHIMRAFGMWGLVEFPNWDPGNKTAPSANARQLLDTMMAVKAFAKDLRRSVSLTDTTIWYACARTPGHRSLSNAELARFLG